uniref:F-box domain-containing protein n=1 Tax=Anopheles culicifacies TaxID=139723 RepID=A0A182MI47_9DIPT
MTRCHCIGSEDGKGLKALKNKHQLLVNVNKHVLATHDLGLFASEKKQKEAVVSIVKMQWDKSNPHHSPSFFLKYVSQYVEEIIYASSEYGRSNSISYNAINVIGRPSNFPCHGAHVDSYLLPSYGNWGMLAPSFTPEFGLGKIPDADNPPVDDFIVVSFERAVYPIGVYVYETLYPGAVYRIWAYTEHCQWILLWDKREDASLDDGNTPRRESRKFGPKIRTLRERTRVLRIEFSTRDSNYLYGIDAIMLKSLMIDMVALERDNPTLPEQLIEPARQQPIQDEPARQPIQHEPSITDMPYEMIFKICTYLDIKSLRNVEKVSAAFHDVVRDSRLYREVNMRPYWMVMNSHLLEWLGDRCANIRKLDLSWCGLFSMITESDLQRFLKRHGRSLTHLRLNSVGFRRATDFVMSLCPNVTELCLQNMHIGDDVQLEAMLTKLTKLDLSGATISFRSLRNILQLSPSLQHLILSCCNYQRFPLADTIVRYNPELVSLNLFKTRTLSANDLVLLANCTKFQELNLGYAFHEEVQEDELSRLFEVCPDLRKLVLAGIRDVHNNDLLVIAQHCPALEYLDLMGCITVTGESVNALFIGCTTLRFLELNHCDQISNEWVTEWKNRYPQVAIKYKEY